MFKIEEHYLGLKATSDKNQEFHADVVMFATGKCPHFEKFRPLSDIFVSETLGWKLVWILMDLVSYELRLSVLPYVKIFHQYVEYASILSLLVVFRSETQNRKHKSRGCRRWVGWGRSDQSNVFFPCFVRHCSTVSNQTFFACGYRVSSSFRLHIKRNFQCKGRKIKERVRRFMWPCLS